MRESGVSWRSSQPAVRSACIQRSASVSDSVLMRMSSKAEGRLTTPNVWKRPFFRGSRSRMQLYRVIGHQRSQQQRREAAICSGFLHLTKSLFLSRHHCSRIYLKSPISGYLNSFPIFSKTELHRIPCQPLTVPAGY